jgi:hypothetical protein
VWDTVTLTPPELMGRFAVEVEGGSTAPKNMPQQIQLAQSMLNDLGQNPHFDTKAILMRVLELYGFSHPEAFMAADEPPIGPDVLDRLQQAGVDPQLIGAAVQASKRENPPEGAAGPQEPPEQQEAA